MAKIKKQSGLWRSKRIALESGICKCLAVASLKTLRCMETKSMSNIHESQARFL